MAQILSQNPPFVFETLENFQRMFIKKKTFLAPFWLKNVVTEIVSFYFPLVPKISLGVIFNICLHLIVKTILLFQI